MILRILDSILPGSGAIIKTTIRAVKRGIAEIVNSFKEDWSILTREHSGDIRPSSEVRVNINNINEEIEDLEKKIHRDGSLNNIDSEHFQELQNKATDLDKEHQISRLHETTSEIIQDPSGSSATSLSSNDHIHILDWSRGPTANQKRCPICNSGMHINRSQLSDDASSPLIKNYFWACQNYYQKGPSKCYGTIQFVDTDMALIHKSGIVELEMKANEFYSITNNEESQKIMLKKLDVLQNVQDIDTTCPIHALPMVPRKKKNPNSVLDIWHLKCPHLKCEQTRKMKDWAQLSGLFRRTTGSGLLE